MPIRLEDVERRADEARERWERGESTLVTPLYGVGVGGQVAGRAAQQTLDLDLKRTGATETVRAAQAGEEDALGIFGAGSPPKWAQYATFDGGVDERTCPLCGRLVGTVVKVGSVEYWSFAPPIHINCLVPAQAVATPGAWTAIEAVEVGDKVIAHDGQEHEVTATMQKHYAGDLIIIETEETTLQVTPEHPVLTQRGWVLAGQLTEQDEVMVWQRGAGFAPTKTASLRRVPYHGEVYNLSVAGCESFVAQNIAVHNCRHWYSYFEDKPDLPDFAQPPAEIVQRYGHFVTQPNKYAPLRVPVVPGASNIQPRRERDPVTGAYTEKLRWIKQPDAPLTPGAQDLLRGLAEKPQIIPAEAFGGAGSRELQELSRAGYVNVTNALGEAQKMTVTKGTVGEVEEFLRQTYAGAKVRAIRQVGALDVGGGVLVPQWEVEYAETNARRVTLNRWGKLAAAGNVAPQE